MRYCDFCGISIVFLSDHYYDCPTWTNPHRMIISQLTFADLFDILIKRDLLFQGTFVTAIDVQDELKYKKYKKQWEKDHQS